MGRRASQLSGGQRQRVAIARALTTRPRLLVADEAVASLDMSARGQVLNLLSDIQDERDLTCVHISHDLSMVRNVCRPRGGHARRPDRRGSRGRGALPQPPPSLHGGAFGHPGPRPDLRTDTRVRGGRRASRTHPSRCWLRVPVALSQRFRTLPRSRTRRWSRATPAISGPVTTPSPQARCCRCRPGSRHRLRR